MIIGLREVLKRLKGSDNNKSCGVSLTVFGDSKLAINKMTGEYKCNETNNGTKTIFTPCTRIQRD